MLFPGIEEYLGSSNIDGRYLTTDSVSASALVYKKNIPTARKKKSAAVKKHGAEPIGYSGKDFRSKLKVSKVYNLLYQILIFWQ